jgi:TRAP-type mannitol/chloroaromatic compound transport system permease small subunit
MSYEKNTNLDNSAENTSTSYLGIIIDGMNALGSVLIFLVMILVCSDVLMRSAFNAPIDGVAEIVAMTIIVIVFLQLASTLRAGRMSRADLFIDPFRIKHPKAGAGLQTVFDLCGTFVCLIIFLASWPLLIRSYTENDFFGVQGVFTSPTWPIIAVVLIGSALAALQYVMLAWSSLGMALRGEKR